MTRHIISKRLKNSLISNPIYTPYLIAICYIILGIGISRIFIPHIWLMYLYNLIIIIYMIYFISMVVLKKQLKPNQSLTTVIGFQLLLCIGSGWWLSLTIWILTTFIVIYLMVKYDDKT